MNRTPYPSDLNDAEWQLLEPLLLSSPPKSGGRPIKYPRREIVNAIRYILRTGAAWRMPPHDLPPAASCFITIVPGSRMASGGRSTMPCASKPGSARAVIPNPAPLLWTASR